MEWNVKVGVLIEVFVLNFGGEIFVFIKWFDSMDIKVEVFVKLFL